MGGFAMKITRLFMSALLTVTVMAGCNSREEGVLNKTAQSKQITVSASCGKDGADTRMSFEDKADGGLNPNRSLEKILSFSNDRH